MSRRYPRGTTWSSTSRLGPVKRCAVLLRGGLACAWCLRDPTPSDQLPGRGLEVDHVVPRAEGGGVHGGNLVPSCGECNTARNVGDAAFAAFLALRGVAYDLALAEVRRQAARPLDVAAGRDLARVWYPWLDGYRERQAEAFRRRYAAKRAREAADLAPAPF